MCGILAMSEENDKENYTDEIEDIQGQLDRNQTLLEVTSLLVLFLLVYIFMTGFGFYAIAIETIIILILIFRFLSRLEKGKI